MAQPRLSDATLTTASIGTHRPTYDRGRVTTGIVHLGLGAFARCHLAVMTDDVLQRRHAAGQSLAWGITGVSLRRSDQRDHLAPQDCLYTTLERGPEEIRARIIGALQSVLVAPEDPTAVLAVMTAPSTHIVTLTITEKGYCHDPATGRLRFDHPDIVADLANPAHPTSVIGFIVEALARRRRADLAPFTVVSCDNLQSNGRVLGALVCQLAAQRDAALAAWIEDRGRFPCTMVDRIVPAATPDDRRAAHVATGLVDEAALSHEPFLQWVIEDDFVDGVRPEWEQAGVEFVLNVAPYEHMKLRMLNAAHSALAYLGYLAGHETIGDAVADPPFQRYCERLWHNEVVPVLDGIPKAALERYATSLARRFANPAIRHRTWQIAMDGSQKLPVRILPTLEARQRMGLSSPCLVLAVAAWMRYVGGVDERGTTIDVRDPLATRLRATLDQAGTDPAQRVAAILADRAIFPEPLAHDARFRRDVKEAYAHLVQHGSAAAVARLANEPEGT